MRVIAVIGMIIGLVLVFAVFFNSMVEMDRPYYARQEVSSFNESIYLVGGLLLFMLSAVLFSVRSLIDSVEKNTKNVSSILYYVSQGPRSTTTQTPSAESASSANRSQSKFADTDFEGIPRKPGETSSEYWDRVETQSSRIDYDNPYAKPGDNPDFPRKSGENDSAYWNRVEREIRK